MFVLPKSYEDSKILLQEKIKDIKNAGINLSHEKQIVYKEHAIDKLVIKPKSESKRKLVFTSGLHGSEGFVGHAAVISVLDNISKYLDQNIEVIIYHIVNPYGMINSCRVNENNVDLNRNFFMNDISMEFEDVKDIKKLYSPKKHKSPFILGIKYLFIYLKVLLFTSKKTQAKYINAIQGGQSKYNDRMCFAGTEIQKATIYLMKEQKKMLETSKKFIWIDLHSGVPFKDYLYIIPCSQYRDNTKRISSVIDFATVYNPKKENNRFEMSAPPLFTPLFYFNDNGNYDCQFLAVIYEFRTSKPGFFSTIKGQIAMILENSARFVKQPPRVQRFIDKNYIKIFRNSNPVWLKNVDHTFIKSIDKLIELEKLNIAK